MKSLVKITFLSLCSLIWCLMASGQQIIAGVNSGKYIWDGREMVDTTKATPQQWERLNAFRQKAELAREHYLINYLGGTENLGVRFDQGGKSKIYEGLEDRSRGWVFTTSVIIDGDSAIELIARGVNEQNAKNYIYHIVQNDERELVGWTTPNNFKKTVNGKYSYAYLGKFNYQPEQVLKVEIYNTKNYHDVDEIVFDWRKVVPAQVMGNIQYTRRRDVLPDNGVFSMGINELRDKKMMLQRFVGNKPVPYERHMITDFLETTDKNDPKFHLADSVKNLNFLILNGRRLYNYKVSLKRTIDGTTDSLTLGETNNDFNLYKEFWKYPGTYQITFTPKIHKHGGNPVFILRNLATNIKFTVLPDLHTERNIPVKTVSYIILILITTAAYMFVMYRNHQKGKLAKAAQNKQIATLQLQAVRSQLNPHFIFNALAGIQNLMNKNEVENANKYLARFARLTRNILDDGNKELTSIEKETELLNDYLLMEQTRFGFQFHIDMDKSGIDQQSEIPAMLLQPFVENAVKHGVSALKDAGMITVSITKKDSSLILSVQDNGKGFSGEQSAGMGMKLCEDRMKLLNSIYKETHITLQKTSDKNGTLIRIELQNWV